MDSKFKLASQKLTSGDVVNNYNWTPDNRDLKGVPYIKLTEYELTGTYMLSNMRYWLLQMEAFGQRQTGENPYEGMYPAEKTGKIFKLPYYNSYHHYLQNMWGPKTDLWANKLVQDALGANNIIGIVRDLLQIYQGTPALGITDTYQHTSIQPATYEVSFLLFNTVNPSEDMKYNKELIDYLIMASAIDRTSAVTYTPPAIYEVEIPGVRFSPAAVINTLNIDNKGHLRLINDKLTPDAWGVSLNLQELIPESRLLFDQSKKTNKTVHAMMAPAEEAMMNKLKQGFEKVGSSITNALHAMMTPAEEAMMNKLNQEFKKSWILYNKCIKR